MILLQNRRKEDSWFVLKAGIAMFMGEYNSYDRYERQVLSFPSKFREALWRWTAGNEGIDGCLFVYDNAEWTALRRSSKHRL